MKSKPNKNSKKSTIEILFIIQPSTKLKRIINDNMLNEKEIKPIKIFKKNKQEDINKYYVNDNKIESKIINSKNEKSIKSEFKKKEMRKIQKLKYMKWKS